MFINEVGLDVFKFTLIRQCLGKSIKFSTKFRLETLNNGPGRGQFVQSPSNFSGPKSDIQIKILYFVSSTDGCIMLDAKLLKPLSSM